MIRSTIDGVFTDVFQDYESLVEFLISSGHFVRVYMPDRLVTTTTTRLAYSPQLVIFDRLK